MTPHELLLELDPWLQRRSGYLATRLPGVGVDEIYQRSVLKFLEQLDRWLKQDPTTHIVAQARTLMGFCLRQVETEEIRRRRRTTDLPGAEEGEDGLESRLPPTPPADLSAARLLLERVRAAASPPNGLCLLSLRLPALVEEEDAVRAKAWRHGGSNAVPRPLPEAWSIYEEGREDLVLVADDIAWKEQVGVAWYTEGPVGELQSGERRTAATKVERYANRGAEQLRNALLSDGDAP
jgi:hypothetical protein